MSRKTDFEAAIKFAQLEFYKAESELSSLKSDLSFIENQRDCFVSGAFKYFDFVKFAAENTTGLTKQLLEKCTFSGFKGEILILDLDPAHKPLANNKIVIESIRRLFCDTDIFNAGGGEFDYFGARHFIQDVQIFSCVSNDFKEFRK